MKKIIYAATLALVAAASSVLPVLLVLGCDHVPPAINIENAAAVAQYEALLYDCRARGKTAGSYAVYEACAAAVDRGLCAERGLLCKDGGP